MAKVPGPVGLAFAVALAAGLMVGTSVGVAADSETGQTGRHLYTDDADHPGATCIYKGQNSPFHLRHINVRAPKVWWPDTNSTNTNQHGMTGWRAVVQQSPGDDAPWTTAYKSPLQKAIAYEDDPPYDLADKAPFTKRSFDFHYDKSKGTYFRVLVKAYWYRSNGSVLGKATHVVQNHQLTLPSPHAGGLYGLCFADFGEL